MHRLVLITVVASVLAVAVASTAVASEPKVRVRMLDRAPLTLQGVGFAGEERVRLTVSLGERTALRKLRANAAGSFTTRFDALRYGRCGPPLEVLAVGSRGHRVSWQLVPLDCPTRLDS